MWRDNFLRILKENGLTTKQLAERSGVSEKTITRIIKNPNATTYLDTLDRLAIGLGCQSSDITQDTKTVIGNESLAELQNKLNLLQSDNELLNADNNLLKSQVTTLTARLELTETKLMYSEKLLAVYEHYNKIKSE